MKHFYFGKQQDLHDLVFQYEVMSQKGKVLKLEETAFLQLIDFYEEKQSPEKALQIVEFGLAQHQLSSDLHIRMARLQLQNQKIELALEFLDRAESFGHHQKELKFLRAKALTMTQNYHEALSLLYEIKQLHYVTKEELSDIHFQEATVYEKQELFDQMFYALKQALLENPANQRAMERMWISVELSRKHEESIYFHRALLDDDPYAYQAWFNLGHAYYSMNKYEKAIEAFEYAFVINDKFELAYRDYAEVCFELKRFDKALKCYLEALEHFDSDPDILAKVGECYEYLGNVAKAKIYFFRALNMDPRSDEVYFHIGECYAAENHLESALHFYKQAIKIDDRREDYLSSLANTYYRLGRPDKALPLFRKAIEIAPEQTSYWTEYAGYLLEMGRVYEAIELMEDAEINSIGAEIQYCKAVCHFKLGQRVQALNCTGEGLMENFAAHKLLFELAPELQADKDVKAIIRYYELD
ncbi:MAG: tetratricopeptide repeat protein [Bacteroidota bacterium]